MNLGDVTACFFDHEGLYLPLAEKLSESYKRVLYFDPKEVGFPTVNDAVIGDSFPANERLERIDDFWPIKHEIDLFIFPDSQGSGLQNELWEQGFPVWGSRNSIDLEQSREKFHKTLSLLGLESAPFERIIGLTDLAEHLKDKEDKYIKISKFRGSLETYHWRSWDDDAGTLDCWRVKFGGVKDLIPFLVFDAIDTEFEIGGDTYCIRGQFPKLVMDGYEWKDKGYFAALKPRDKAPEQLQEVLNAFAPILGQAGHNNFWTMEIRVKDEHSYFIDPTPRGPLPATGSQMEIYGNLAEIIIAGANGELVEPEPLGKFSAECVLTIKGEKEGWSSTRVPDDLKQWMKLGGNCKVNGRTWFPPSQSGEDTIGWLVAIGDTPTETIETILERAGKLPDGVCAATDSLANLLKEIHKAEAEGIPFTEMKVPEPAIVIEEA